MTESINAKGIVSIIGIQFILPLFWTTVPFLTPASTVTISHVTLVQVPRIRAREKHLLG
jgi:hypothetical protein